MSNSTQKPSAKRMASFLEDEDTPRDVAVRVPSSVSKAALPAPAPPPELSHAPALARPSAPPAATTSATGTRTPRSRAARAKYRPEASLGDYPWRTPQTVALQDVRKQVPVRLPEGTRAKLAYLDKAGVIKSMASFMENLITPEVERLLIEHLTIDLGMSETEAREIAAIPKPNW